MNNPDILLVIADDQPKGTLDAMPAVRSLIRDGGIQFENAISQTSLCSPARSSILTGDYSHTTGVWTNYATDQGSWTAFSRNGNEESTLGTRLRAAGYHTALVGKYLNHFSSSGPDYIPPGWSDFITMQAHRNNDLGGAGSYYNYDLRGTIERESHGDMPEDYSTDVLRDKARGVIADAPAKKPLFLMFTPWGPHGNYEPAPRHQGTWNGGAELPGSFNEEDMSDKPDWMQNAELASEAGESRALIRIHEALMSIDEAVAALHASLVEAGRADNLLLIYMSDNGKMLGSHRMVKKDLPHRWAGEVPLLMRWDGVLDEENTEVRRNRITPNVDVTATIAEAAGIKNWKMDGKSVISKDRKGCLVEQMRNPEQRHPAYCGWRTDRHLFVEYTAEEGRGRELYDYKHDPDELDNLAFDLDSQDLMHKLRDQAQAACDPVPPGFSWRVGVMRDGSD